MTRFEERQRRRTYTPQQMAEARAAWDAGRFSAEWKPWRHLAAMEAGIAEPPEGTAFDSWSDDSPSQRAILIRAIRETPALLERAIRTAPRPTWVAVIGVLLRGRDDVARSIDADSREAQQHKQRELTPKQATYRLADILETIGGSR